MEAGTIDLDRYDRGILVVTLRGEHDLATARRLQETLAWWFSYSVAVIVDLSEATFIDSSILKVFIMAMRDRQPIALVAPPGGAPRRLFDLVRLDDAIPTYDTFADALARQRGRDDDLLADPAAS